ncbi:MAG: zinc metallopeptidase [Verrucomicrobia bacterium]|nr:zinc metallopeptidase [Verrucomicrobiota bacterium]
MWKILLLVSLLPTVVAVLARKWLCDRVVRPYEGHMTSRSGRELAEGLLKAAGRGASISVAEKRKAGVVVDPPQLVLSSALAEARDVVSLGKGAALTGQALVAADQPQLMRWRQWVLRFSWAFPVFTAVVLVFAVVVAKLAASWAIVILLGALGLASALSLASVMIEVEGAKLVLDLMERSRVLPRRDEEEEVGLCCRAMAYRQVVPGAVEWMF